MRSQNYRVRYAPSPTGNLHIGNARTALFNYLFAHHYEGSFIVRVEDTDLKRNDLSTIDQQFADLTFLGLKADESIQNPGAYGPYQQTHRLSLYDKYTQKLLATKKAYYCFCSAEDLVLMKAEQTQKGVKSFQYDGRCSQLTAAEIKACLQAQKPSCVRFLTPKDKAYMICDLVRGEVKFQAKDVGDFVIMKQNQTPSYNFAVVVDDHAMHITHVIRGEEHLTNTAKQLMLYEAFAWQHPQFAHLTLIVNEQKQKLSKRDRNVRQFIQEYRSAGFLPSAIVNYLALLGWTPAESENEIFTIQQLITIFDPNRFSKSASMFDEAKMRWVNKKHLQMLTEEEYLIWSKPFLAQYYPQIIDKPVWWINQLLCLLRSEITIGADFATQAALFFKAQVLDQATQATQANFSQKKALFEMFQTHHFASVASLQDSVRAFGKTHHLKGKQLFMPLRIMTTHSDHGPALAAVLFLLGKQKVLANIKMCLKEQSNGN